jgi:flagellar basal body-associated protein FliL
MPTNKDETRPQPIYGEGLFRKSTFILSMALNTFITGAIMVVVMWFFVTNIHDSAREAVISDIKAAGAVTASTSKTQQ